MNSTSLTVSTTTFSRKATAQVALAVAIFAASLWDFRLATLRIFDLASLAFLAAFFALSFDANRHWLSRRVYVLPLVIVIIMYAGLGYVNFHHRSSLAVALLALMLMQLAGSAEISLLARVFRWVVYLHVAALVAQYVAFHIFGFVLDPLTIVGERARVTVWGGGATADSSYLRPAGLFIEPNNYALNMFLAATAALVPSRDRSLALIAAGSMLLTESMWAVVAAFVLVALNEWNSAESFVRKAAATLMLWVAIFVVFNGYLWLLKPATAKLPPIYARVLNVATDGSARDRYGALIDRKPVFVCPACQPKSVAFHLPKPFGKGLSTATFFSAVPDNGFSFIWYCMGPVGLSLLIGTLAWSLYGAALQDLAYVLAAAVFAFTTYPIITYVIFWLWLVAMISLVRGRAGPVGAPGSLFARRLQIGWIKPSSTG